MRLINIFQSQAKISTSSWSQFYQILEVMWKVEINYFCIYEPNYEKGLQLQINPLHNTWNVNCKGYETIFAKTCLVQKLFKLSSLHKALIDELFSLVFNFERVQVRNATTRGTRKVSTPGSVFLWGLQLSRTNHTNQNILISLLPNPAQIQATQDSPNL